MDTLEVPVDVPQAPESPGDMSDSGDEDPTVTEDMAREESALQSERDAVTKEEHAKVRIYRVDRLQLIIFILTLVLDRTP